MDTNIGTSTRIIFIEQIPLPNENTSDHQEVTFLAIDSTDSVHRRMHAAQTGNYHEFRLIGNLPMPSADVAAELAELDLALQNYRLGRHWYRMSAEAVRKLMIRCHTLLKQGDSLKSLRPVDPTTGLRRPLDASRDLSSQMPDSSSHQCRRPSIKRFTLRTDGHELYVDGQVIVPSPMRDRIPAELRAG